MLTCNLCKEKDIVQLFEKNEHIDRITILVHLE